MTTSRSSLAACATVGLMLALPAASQAATKSVNMGTPPSLAKTLQQKYFSDANAFFPSSVAVHVGDRVKFVPVGFHNVRFLGKGAKLGGPFVPTGKAVAGATDAAGVPFAFNGQPALATNPAIFGPGQLGKTVVTNGSKDIQSGLPLSPKPKPMTVRFTKAGLFRYYCELHPGMKGSVRVATKRTPVPSAAADARRVRLQAAKATAVAKGFKNVKPPANTINLGLGGSGGVSLFAFSPSKLTVPVGTTVTFRMHSRDLEVHTATAGPGDAQKAGTYLGKIAASLESPNPDQAAFYPSEFALADLTPTLHGNGFWNSGVLDGPSASPLPRSNSVRFAAAGTYDFYCLIHPFMKGTVTAR